MASDAIILPDWQHKTNRLIWQALALWLAVNALWLYQSGVRLVWGEAAVFLIIFALCAALSLVYRYVRRDDRIWLLGNCTNQLLLATGVGGVFSYLTARANFPLIDEKMIAIDRLFGFDWLRWIHTLETMPEVASILSFAYRATGPQLILFCAILFLCKQGEQLQRFIIAFITAAFITIILAMIFPAVGGYVHYNIDPDTLRSIPAAARLHEAPLLGMRDRTLTELGFPLLGIVTFPSFHTTLALLLIFAAYPVRWLFWLSLPVNVLTVLSTPYDGGHYLSDVAGGVVVALIAVLSALRLAPGAPSAATTRQR